MIIQEQLKKICDDAVEGWNRFGGSDLKILQEAIDRETEGLEGLPYPMSCGCCEVYGVEVRKIFFGIITDLKMRRIPGTIGRELSYVDSGLSDYE